MSLRGLHGHTEAFSATWGVQWIHSIQYEKDFVDELRAQLLGVVAEHVVRFELCGFSLLMDEDPRIQSGLQVFCTDGFLEDESPSCTDCQSPRPLESSLSVIHSGAHAKARAAVVSKSALHTAPHLLPLRVSFQTGAQQTQNSWARQVNRLGVHHTQHFASLMAPCPANPTHTVEALSQQMRSLACTATVPLSMQGIQVCTGTGVIGASSPQAHADGIPPPVGGSLPSRYDLLS